MSDEGKATDRKPLAKFIEEGRAALDNPELSDFSGVAFDYLPKAFDCLEELQAECERLCKEVERLRRDGEITTKAFSEYLTKQNLEMEEMHKKCAMKGGCFVPTF